MTLAVAHAATAEAPRVATKATGQCAAEQREHKPSQAESFAGEINICGEPAVGPCGTRIAALRVELHHQLPYVEDLQLVEEVHKCVGFAWLPRRFDIKTKAHDVGANEVMLDVMDEAVTYLVGNGFCARIVIRKVNAARNAIWSTGTDREDNIAHQGHPAARLDLVA